MTRASAIPAVLLPALEAAESRYRENGGAPERPPAAAAETLSRVWAVSSFVAQNCARDPKFLEELAASGDLNSDASPTARVQAQLKDVPDERVLMTRLRQIRRREMTRIAWRDLAGGADLDETLRDLSDLADALTQGALAHLARWHAERHGTARNDKGVAQSLVVLGLGKLGARELNFSSDVDLIFAYPEGGASDGERPLDNEEYFLRLAQKLTKALDEATADGFVFRVDLRLRPFGEAGPVALSFDAMETYYQNHGREWERYAFIKARPIAGDIKAGEKLLQALRPFVYRRYLDYGAFESLRDMKAMLAQEVERRGLSDNVKLGPGGIREIEFIGQVFQLIRGGREPQLRERGIVPVLKYLGSKDYLDLKDAAALLNAYVFLRRVENRLQQAGDQQVHELPEDELGRVRLAFSMGYADWAALKQELDVQREAVHRIFQNVVVAPKAVQEETKNAVAWADDAEAEARLAALGYADPKEAARVLHSLREGATREQGERSRRLLQALLPRLVTAAVEARKEGVTPDETLKRLARVVEAIAKRSAYLSLLTENPTALGQLARLAAESVWLVDMVVRSPILLDELIDPRIFKEFPSQDSLYAEMESMLAGIAPDDLEMQMDALRQFQQAAVVHAAAADLAGNAPLMKVSDFLTWTAEQVIRKALEIAWRQLIKRHGRPQCIEHGRLRDARFAVVAYGKLGGLELGYGSDLDVVFLHDSRSGEQQTNGPKVLDNLEFFTRLAQRVINILSIPTTSGVLYQVDTRLRPSGGAGLIVSSMDGFAQYQEQQAWTWEHQALLRARPVAGDREVAELFNGVRRSVLGRPRDPDKLREDIAAMRARMREEHKRAGQDFDLKLDPGGLTDIEFMVQYWVLAHAHAHPKLLDWTDNIRNLEGLIAAGVVPEATCNFLADTYRDFRRRVHRLTLEGRPARVPPYEVEPARQQVRELWQKVLGPAA
ncbi:MAG TPA: bifunctional [glutamate--ammonia ligase]-adenylyl-L-tyrosine phosphorylase/[glutamate--ammonia-ligase] adenylyltransferase [Gammaproteobacteria bacterium]|jgi:glutamate-ammonia-ligase adenylyltransferase|nr:bifunctional [glutamate--ammonia ligase]-adenylyl-L-tyrosine phosphorylase/[glutamate--ammonia-ligase] adenylyltransferase [Gammaproteobacteria bacterium]